MRIPTPVPGPAPDSFWALVLGVPEMLQQRFAVGDVEIPAAVFAFGLLEDLPIRNAFVALTAVEGRVVADAGGEKAFVDRQVLGREGRVHAVGRGKFLEAGVLA